ncbi:MAG: fructosamine kinase family protein [Gallionella sp.]|nr:MAG: fructosamine kinase family protein [Gallionella sp.]
MTDWPAISDAIASATGQPFRLAGHIRIGGGCINEAFRLEGAGGQHYFLKLNDARHLPMFAAEAAGLGEIGATRVIRVPRPIAHGIAGAYSFLVLEYLDMGVRGNAALLGEHLAALHRCAPQTRPRFGFAQGNFIGTTPQPNGWSDGWIAFWRERRLCFQLRLAAENGYGGRLQTLGGELADALPGFFAGYTPQPALLHGDLWSGNHAYLPDGTPAIFDPAPYYGDRECDLAMTELFGGYDANFYAAYRAAYPPDAGYATRRDLYNLYPILNHANLFGGNYAQRAERMMQRLLAVVGR